MSELEIQNPNQPRVTHLRYQTLYVLFSSPLLDFHMSIPLPYKWDPSL